MVDSPVFDRRGRLYVTHSGTRGVKVPVPLFRVRPDGGKDPVAVDIANATSMAAAPDGSLFVSSRFDGHVYRLTPDDRAEVYATELGVPTGLVVASDGTLFVGDRSGSVFRVSPDRQVDTFATLPASVAAFHLALGPDEALYVTAPTLSSHDGLYRISRDRLVDTVFDGFGRPQGLAFDHLGRLYVVDALAGAAGLYRVDLEHPESAPELLVSAAALVGVAFDPSGGLILASSDAVWRLDVPLSSFTSRQDG
jgi:sugar lactone lactonase YvrE